MTRLLTNNIRALSWVASTFYVLSLQSAWGGPAQLEQTVITGTRSERVLLDTPVRTEVITSESIQQIHARNAKEALSLAPGLQIQKIHGKTGYEVGMQGVSSGRVLVLIDGEPVSASSGSTVDLTQISTINIDRIEIVKGATSALYGSNAIGGVINIISSPIDTNQYLFRWDGGSFGSQNLGDNELSLAQQSAAGLAALKGDQWQGQANFDFVSSEGFNPYEHSWDQYGPKSFKLNSQFTLGFEPDRHQNYYLTAGLYDESTEYRFTDNRGGRFIEREKIENADRLSLKAGAHWQSNSIGDVELRFYSEIFKDKTNQDIRSTPYIDQQRDAEIKTQKISTQWNTPSHQQHSIIMGAEYITEALEQELWTQEDNERISSTELSSNPTRNNTVFYLQDDLKLSEKWELLPGFRLQHDSDFGSHLAPKINGRFELPLLANVHQQFIRFGVGSGYRVPSLKERYYVFDHSQHGYQVLGNTNLDPERSNSYQLGWVLTNPEHYFLDINFFRNDLRDLIETALQNNTSQEQGNVSIYRYINIGRAKTQGMETSANIHIFDSLQWSFAYTWLDTEDQISQKELPKRPQHQINTSVEYQAPIQGLSFTLIGHWQSKSWYDIENLHRADAWSRFDFKVNYQYTPYVKLFGGIDNVSDTQRSFFNEYDLRPDEGRFLYLGFDFTDN